MRALLHFFLAALISTAATVDLRAESASSSNSKPFARIALLSDPHVNRATSGEDAASKAHFETAIAQVNAAKVDLVLIAGDLSQSGKPEEWADFKTHIKSLQVPVLYVPGNHDVGHKVNSGRPGTITPAYVGSYEKNLGPSWFVKKESGVRVIGVNSSLLGSGFERETEMWKFLDHELSQPSRVPTLVFMHYPLFLKDLNEPGGSYYNVEPTPRLRLYELLQRGGVKLMLTGHLHKPLKIQRDGILLLSTPPISFGIPRGKQPEGWTLVEISKDGDVKDSFQPLR